jgi:NodT family efflux transporter outer membrane factor (OMF) lipoprotein
MRRAALLLVAVAGLGPAAPAVVAQESGATSGEVVAGVPTRGRAMPPAHVVFSDTTLQRLIREAQGANPDLDAARARIRGARAERFDAALDLAPSLTATGGYTRQRISGVSFPGLSGTLPDQGLWEAGIQLSWEVDAFGRVRRSLEGRSWMLDAAEEDVQDARLLLGAEVASSYYRLQGGRDRLRVAQRNAENQRRTLAVTRDRLDAGRGTALDTERARAQLSSTLAAIPALEGAIAAEERRLAVLLGRNPGVPLDDLATAVAATPLPEPTSMDAEAAIRRRPDVIGAEHRLAASDAFVGAAKASYLPRISIQGAAGYTAAAFDALGNAGTTRYAVGPVVSWPLLDLARVKSGVDAAEAGRSEARARYEGALLRARNEVETSLVDYRTARARLGHLADAAEASRHAAELARLRFEEGAGDFLDVLDAERRLLEAEDRLSAGRTDATDALVAVYRATGAEWTDPDGPGRS